MYQCLNVWDSTLQPSIFLHCSVCVWILGVISCRACSRQRLPDRHTGNAATPNLLLLREDPCDTEPFSSGILPNSLLNFFNFFQLFHFFLLFTTFPNFSRLGFQLFSNFVKKLQKNYLFPTFFNFLNLFSRLSNCDFRAVLHSCDVFCYLGGAGEGTKYSRS